MKKYNVTVNGTVYEVCVEEVDASQTSFTPAPVAAPVAAPAPTPVATPAPAPATAPQPQQSAPAAVGGTSVTAPMPGTILDVKVSVGASVKKGDVICVLEAMKMENDIPAPSDGVVASVNVQKGASVASGQVIVTLK